MSLRKTVLFIVLTAISIQLKAQIDKGFWLAGGSLSWASGNTKPASLKRTVFTFTPKIGYFLIDNLAAGMTGRWESETLIVAVTNTQDTKTRYTSFAVGPFVRYYLLKSERDINVFTDASALFGANKQKGEKSNGLNQYMLTAGASFFFTTSSALELSIGYQSTKYKTDPSSVFSSTFFGLGFQVHLIKN